MSHRRRPSPQTVAVLGALAAEPTAWRYGYELGLEVGLKAGSLYPILMRLTDRGLLEASWETDPPVGRPPGTCTA
jgi:PadR family transcriptional regulator, regulatory protein PadR